MGKPNVLMTTMEYDMIKVGGLSAALTSITHSLKKHVNPIVILPKSGYNPPWKQVEERRRSIATTYIYEHEGVCVYALSNRILDIHEIYPVPEDLLGIKKIDEFSRVLAEVVRDIDFDVVHMQDFFAYKAMDKFKEMGKPVLLTIHRLHREYPSWFLGERASLEKADYITVVGESYYKEDEKDLFRSYSNKTTHVFNGVDTGFWNIQACSFPKLPREMRKKKVLQKYGLKDGVLFTYVGRFDPVQKGVDVLLEASDRFLKTENARMIVVGVGDKKLENQAKGLEKAEPSKLRFINQLLPKETVRDIYCSADFALVPSLFEPFGLVQLEAMSSECVPIGSRTGGIKDTIVSYDDDLGAATGFLVEKGRSEALLEGMKKALRLRKEEPDTLERMRRNGRQRCETVFQWDAAAKKYVSLYEKLLQDAGRVVG